MKNKKILWAMFSVVLAFGFVLAGCAFPNKNDDGPGGNVEARAIVNFPTTSTNPEIQALINQTTGYQLTITKGGEEVYNQLLLSTQTSVTITLTTGVHVFSATAMKNTDILGTGTVTKELVVGVNVNVKSSHPRKIRG